MKADMLAVSDEPAGFVHEAMLYERDEGFVAGALPFVRDGVEAGEPVLVAVSRGRLDLLRDALGDLAREVELIDMAGFGRNPARIIPRWQEFIAAHADAPAMRGIGEPIWAERSSDELIECQQHEALLNLAFADAGPFQLVCPYDVTRLPQPVIDEALRSHPFVARAGRRMTSRAYAGIDAPSHWFEAPLPEPRAEVTEIVLDGPRLAEVRHAVAARAASLGLPEEKADDFVLAVGELVTNTIRHGGGTGKLRLWRDDGMLVCEIRDKGRFDQPLVGRIAPQSGQHGGFGLWLVNQLCDLVQIRSLEHGSVVRVHMALA